MPTFQTNRLNLYPMSSRFGDELNGLHSCDIVMQHLGGKYSREETEQKIKLSEDHWLTYGFGLWCWFDKETDAFIGRGGLRYQTIDDGTRLVEIAYMMHQQYWGNGYASEVAQYSLDLAFIIFNFQKVFALTIKPNIASQNVMKRAGMLFDGTVVNFRNVPHLVAYKQKGDFV
jgi:[ribosomal protein S5]-alanine N-acetyltransferase